MEKFSGLTNAEEERLVFLIEEAKTPEGTIAPF